MFKKSLLVVFFSMLAFVSTYVLAQDISDDLQHLNNLEHSGSYQQIILSLPDEQYHRDKKHIALDPATMNVDIIAQDIRYEEEAESFAKHRRHYVAFWTIFLFMFGVDILWAE